MADIVHLLIHLLWAAVAAYAATLCSRWYMGRVADGRITGLKIEVDETKKTVVWLRSELEKLRAIPQKPPRF